MPNHVRNELYFNCEDRSIIDNLMNQIKGDETEIDFEKIIPMPSDIYRGNLGLEEEKLYKGRNWYDWSIKNWGTKWNAYETEKEYNSVSFLTAWSAPIRVIEKLSSMFPSVTITHYFADEDIGYNCGRIVYKDGKIVAITDQADGSEEDVKFACDIWGYSYEEYLDEMQD